MHMVLSGNDNTLLNTKMIVRGSFPYGYGSLFGIGSSNTFGLNKRGGMQVIGQNSIIDGIEIQLEAFGHALFIQSPADNTTIRNSLVEGVVRNTNDMLAEGVGSLPYQADYIMETGDPIPEDEMESLAEDGFRVYSGGGSVILEDSIVRRMRGGVRLYLASSATVTNTLAVDNGEVNINLPSNSSITNSTANFTNGPMMDFRLSRSRNTVEVTILPSPNAVGAHNIADILGNDHDIVFHRADGPEDTQETRVIVVEGSNSTIRNETEYAIVLVEGTSGNTVISAGNVTDNGDNDVSSITLEIVE